MTGQVGKMILQGIFANYDSKFGFFIDKQFSDPRVNSMITSTTAIDEALLLQVSLSVKVFNFFFIILQNKIVQLTLKFPDFVTVPSYLRKVSTAGDLSKLIFFCCVFV